MILLHGYTDSWRSYERGSPASATVASRACGDAARTWRFGQAGWLVRSEQDELSRAIKTSRLVVYEGAGHSPHWEEPERFAGQVASFVAGLQLEAARHTDVSHSASHAQPRP